MPEYTVAITGWRPGARKKWASRVVRDESGLELKAAKLMIDVALNGGLVRIEVQTEDEARRLVNKLKEFNFDATIE